MTDVTRILSAIGRNTTFVHRNFQGGRGNNAN
jgi:hypothetical protein